MTSADTGLAIWGIDAPLRGTEGAILGLHPAVLLEDGAVAVIRRLGWDPGTEAFLARVGTPAVARREITELQFVGGAQPRILPHQLVVLIGPTFWNDLNTVLPTDVTALPSPVFEIHSGHRIVLLPAFEYESFAQRLGVKCRKAFDRELVETSPPALTPRACAAIRLLEGNGHAPRPAKQRRRLVAARLSVDFDKYERVRDSIIADEGTDEATLIAWVDGYLRDLGHHQILIGAEATDDPSSAGMVGSLIGFEFYQQEIAQRRSDGDVQPRFMWDRTRCDELRHNVVGIYGDALSGSSGLILASAMALRTSQNAVQWENRFGIRKAYDALSTRTRLHAAADRLARTIPKGTRTQVQSLTIGVSQFPEDRIFAKIAELALNAVAPGVKVAKQRIAYGDLAAFNECDALLQNELCVPPEQPDIWRSEPIFRHIGYHAFVSRRYLVEIISGTNELRTDGLPSVVPPDIRDTAEALLSLRTWEVDDRDDEDDRRKRIGLAARAGLPLYENSEYENINRALEEYIGPIQPVRLEPEAFAESLREFLQGMRDVYWGGSIHARLLQRMWPAGREVIPILGPKDFAALVLRSPEGTHVRGAGFPVNQLMMRRQSDPNLEASINSFYREIARFILQTCRAAQRGNHEAIDFVCALCMYLAPRDGSDSETAWAFVPDWETMIQLLIEDNDMVLDAPRAGGGGIREVREEPEGDSGEKGQAAG